MFHRMRPGNATADEEGDAVYEEVDPENLESITDDLDRTPGKTNSRLPRWKVSLTCCVRFRTGCAAARHARPAACYLRDPHLEHRLRKGLEGTHLIRPNAIQPVRPVGR